MVSFNISGLQATYHIFPSRYNVDFLFAHCPAFEYISVEWSLPEEKKWNEIEFADLSAAFC